LGAKKKPAGGCGQDHFTVEREKNSFILGAGCAHK
jgi:hypothetical protein